MHEIRHYLTPQGKDVFMEWRRKLRDTAASIAIDRRIGRMELENFGDHRFCRDGVWELRIDTGPGCTTRWLEQRLFFCSLAVINARRIPILIAPANIGSTGKGETDDQANGQDR